MSMSVAELVSKRAFLNELCSAMIGVEAIAIVLTVCAVVLFINLGERMGSKGKFLNTLAKIVFAGLLVITVSVYVVPTVIEKQVIAPINETLKSSAEDRDYVVLLDGKETQMTKDEAYEYKNVNSKATITDDTTIKVIYLSTKQSESSIVSIMAPISALMCGLIIGGMYFMLSHTRIEKY